MPFICGFLVVRKPDQNFDEVCDSPYYLASSPPCIEGVCYSGLSRVPWFELDEHFYAGTLPKELVEIREELEKINQPYLDIKLIKDFDTARKILEYSNSIQDRYEIAVVFSDKLSKNKGSFETNLNIYWLGLDIYYSGYGSQIKEGIFNKPSLFDDFLGNLNSNGLFDNNDDVIEAYVKKYNEVAVSGNLEPMFDVDHELKDLIIIGKVKLDF